MSRFHIHTKSQHIEECKSKRRCKHGSFKDDHFPTAVAAAAYLGYRSNDLDVLEYLSNHDAMEVRRAVAHNETATADFLFGFAFTEMYGGEGHHRVLRAIAENANADASTLALLAADDDTSVRVLEAVARHDATPIAVLEVLAVHSDHDVRTFVAGNPHTPYSILEVLAEDYQPVRDAVRERAKLLPFAEGVFLTALIGARDDEDAAFYKQLNNGF